MSFELYPFSLYAWNTVFCSTDGINYMFRTNQALGIISHLAAFTTPPPISCACIRKTATGGLPGRRRSPFYVLSKCSVSIVRICWTGSRLGRLLFDYQQTNGTLHEQLSFVENASYTEGDSMSSNVTMSGPISAAVVSGGASTDSARAVISP